MEPQTAILAKCVSKAVVQSVHHFCCSTGIEAHYINYKKKSSFIPANSKVMIVYRPLAIGSSGSHPCWFTWFNLSEKMHTDSFIPGPFQVPLCIRVRAKKTERWDCCSLSGMKESELAHLLCIRTCRAFHISLLSPKNDPVRAAVSKWILLWKLIAGIVFASSLTLPLHQMAPNPSASQEPSTQFWQGWEGMKINPKAESSPSVYLQGSDW